MDGKKLVKNERKVIVLSSSSSSSSSSTIISSMSSSTIIQPDFTDLDDDIEEEGEIPEDGNRRKCFQPRVPCDGLLPILAASASDDQKLKLTAFQRLKELKPPEKMKLLRVLENEANKSTASLETRLAAFDALSGLYLTGSSILSLLRLSYTDASCEIRCKALKTLESVIASKEVKGSLSDDYATEKDTDAFDVIAKLPKEDFNAHDVIFGVLSHVAANDIDRDVRLLAMELIGKLSPEQIKLTVMLQSVKKDQLQCETVEGESPRKKKKRLKKLAITHALPLLSCGVFAHGIEDQFVRIRLAALVSLFSLLNRRQAHRREIIDKSLCVFLDALLDECDLIRLAALKFLRNLGNNLALTVQSGLESLLAVLDDQNGEIRREALMIIRDNLSLCDAPDANSTRSATITETILRTQRCIEAAILKYPEMEFPACVAIFNFMKRAQITVEKSCNELCSALMQCQIPKYMLPSTLLPGYTYGMLSNVHLIMQIPFLGDEKVKRARLVKLISRIHASDSDKLEFLKTTGFVHLSGNNVRKTGSVADEQIKRFNSLVVNGDRLEVRYEAEKHDKRAYYFLNEDRPVTYVRINSVEKSDEVVWVKDFKSIGPLEHVKMALVMSETQTAPIPFKLKYGNTFVASFNGHDSFRIVNMSNGETMYKE